MLTNANSATEGSGSREDTQPASSPLVVEGNVSNTMHSMPSQSQISHALSKYYAFYYFICKITN